MKCKLFIISIIVLCTLPLGVHAQGVPTSIDGIQIAISPENPAPGQNVDITIQDYQSDINKAKIAWLKNQKQFAQGMGLNTISVTAPASGKTLEIMAVITTSDGAEIRKVITIKSGDIDMVWETGGYTPPLYKGKVPFAYQNYLKVVAIPHLVDVNGKTIKPSQLVYKWKKDDVAMQDQSGFGKQSIVIKGDIVPRPFSITVDVGSVDSTVHGTGDLRFEAAAPTITFYEDDPLYGVYYNKAVGDAFTLSHNEAKILSAPYGFNINSGLTYEWSINQILHDELAQNKNIVLKVNGTDQGRSDVSLTLKNIGDDILQSATANFTAIFNGSSQNTSQVTF